MIRLILCLGFFIPALSIGGGLYYLKVGERAVIVGMVMGGLAGVLFGCIFGGAIGPDSKIANFLFGPGEKDQ